MTEKVQYKHAVCKGSFFLGTACGACERCLDERVTAVNKAMEPIEKSFMEHVKMHSEIGFGRMIQLIKKYWDEEVR